MESIPQVPIKAQAAKEVFELADAAQLDAFETEFVQLHLPSKYTDKYSRWETRKPLSVLITPPKFYGRLVNVLVVPLDKPFDELNNSGHSRTNRKTIDQSDMAERTIGFDIFADLHSTGRGVIGSTQSKAWIWQRSDGQSIRSTSRLTNGEYGRLVEKPIRTRECIEELLVKSSDISLKLLSYAVRYPYMGGFESKRSS